MVAINKVLKKMAILLSLFCIATSCGTDTDDSINKKSDNHVESPALNNNEKAVLEKLKLMLTSDVGENDTFIFNSQKYIINEMYIPKIIKIGKKYYRRYIFKNGIDFTIQSDNPENLSNYDIEIVRKNNCKLYFDYSANTFYTTWNYEHKRNISSSEATALLLQLYTGKDLADICKNYVKEIKL